MTRALVGPAAALARIAVAAAIALVAPTAASRAEDDVVRDEVPGQPADEQDGNRLDLGINFDANLFGQSGGFAIRARRVAGREVEPGMAGTADAPLTARMRAVGEARLARVDRACTLDAGQRRKLELAIESDVKRCVREIDDSRQAYVGMEVNLRDREGQVQWNRFQQDVQRCRRRLATLFDETSLFAEALTTVLDERQLSALASEVAARRSFRWRALVARAMVRLDEALALSQEQYAEVERLLLGKEPPLRINGTTRPRADQAEQLLVFMVLAEVDQQALKAAVGDERWKKVVVFANQGRQMRSWIQGQDLLESPPQ